MHAHTYARTHERVTQRTNARASTNQQLAHTVCLDASQTTFKTPLMTSLDLHLSSPHHANAHTHTHMHPSPPSHPTIDLFLFPKFFQPSPSSLEQQIPSLLYTVLTASASSLSTTVLMPVLKLATPYVYPSSCCIYSSSPDPSFVFTGSSLPPSCSYSICQRSETSVAMTQVVAVSSGCYLVRGRQFGTNC